MQIQPVKSAPVWRQVKIILMGAALLFLINIYFGFDNALTAAGAEIPRWQLLIHLHAGSIGWITLSAIGIAIWLLTGDRDVTPAYENRVRLLGWAAVIVFAGYVPNFWLAFSRPGGALVALLPIFGSAAVIVLWASTIYALSQLGQQDVLQTIHILISGALLVAAVGATVGALLGMERVIGQFLPLPPGPDRVGAHAGMMDTYLFLVAAAVIEWFTRKEAKPRWSVAGLIQGLAWTVGATLVPIAFFTGAVEQLLPIFGIALLLGLVIFLARAAWRAIVQQPFGEWPRPWATFATVSLIIYLGLFLYAVNAPSFESLPSWFAATFVHVGFVGMMTNVLFGVLSARGAAQRQVVAWGESVAFWVMNLGLILFLALKIAADIRLGAVVMGIGVLLGVFTLFMRLRAGEAPATARQAMAVD